MKTIVFFYHNFGGLGHLSRIYNIALEIVENFWDEYKILILSSGEKQSLSYMDSRIKILHLPVYQFDGYTISNTLWNKKVALLRQWIYKKLFSTLTSPILVVEHFPFWRNFLTWEIKDMISQYRSIDATRRVFSSLRDIVDRAALQREHLELFDRILIHGDRTLHNYDDFFTPEENKKVFYTGYVIPKFEDTPVQQKEDYILVSLWGGQDGFSLVEDFLKVFETVAFSWKVYINLGKMFSKERKIYLESISFHTLIIQDIFEDFMELKKGAKIIVSMWGYNNVYENLSLWKTNIIYPRQDYEQETRVDILSVSTPLLYDGRNMTQEVLQKILTQDIQSKESQEYNFMWAYASASFIALFGKHKFIKIRLLNACNAECDMCGVIRRPLEKNNVEVLKQTIQDFFLIGGQIVNFTWGEPTIYKWFYDLLDTAKSYNLITSVSTNGSTFGKKFYQNITHRWMVSIDHMDISVDAVWDQHDVIRAMPGLFGIIQKNIPILQKLWIILHINVTIRKDNIEDLEKIYDFFATLKIDSLSFSMIDSSPFHDVVYLYPSKSQLEDFYNTTIPILESRRDIQKLSISPLKKDKDLSTFIEWILWKHNYPRISWNKCPFISVMSEIRINENGALSPCCEIDDYDENIWNINTTALIDILTSPWYYSFINKTYPNISVACLSCKIVV